MGNHILFALVALALFFTVAIAPGEAHFTVAPPEVVVGILQDYTINIHSDVGNTVKVALTLPPTFAVEDLQKKPGWQSFIDKSVSGETTITWVAIHEDEGIPNLTFDGYGFSAVADDIGTYKWIVDAFFIPGEMEMPAEGEVEHEHESEEIAPGELQFVEFELDAVTVVEKPLNEQLSEVQAELDATKLESQKMIVELQTSVSDLELANTASQQRADSASLFGIGGIAVGVIGLAVGTLALSRPRKS